jgi:predicted lipid-binding transport protein (Tim44 family)
MTLTFQCWETDHMFHTSRFRAFVAIAALAGALAFVAAEAVAKPGGGGSRGSRTFSSPAPTATAPGGAKPIERTMTQPTQAQRPGTTAQAPAAGAQQGGLFGNRFGGFGGGLMAGLLGAGLIGMLMGGGLFSGLSGAGFAGFLGLLLQVALVAGIAYFAWTWWQRRQAGGLATASGPAMRNMSDRPGERLLGRPGYGGGNSSNAMAAAPAASTDVEITEDDFNAFERNLTEVQAAYSAEDLAKLRTLVTPEMLGYMAEDLSDNASRGVINTTGEIKLLQGDLAEAWNEDGRDYATVAMRYSLTDVTRERASGKVVEGSETPQETTELWTFLRSRGGAWILSAIQEAE